MYIEYDEFGLKEIRCMVCEEIVARRTYVEVPHKTDGSKTEKVMTVQRLSNWRQPRKIKIETDGLKSFIEPIVCIGCEKIEWDEDKIMEQYNNGFEAEVKATGRSQKPKKIKKEEVKGPIRDNLGRFVKK